MSLFLSYSHRAILLCLSKIFCFSSCTVDKFYGRSAPGRTRIAELLDRIDEGEEPADRYYIEPPDSATAILTDEDSGDEESGNMNNLPGSMLRATIDDSKSFPESHSEIETRAPSKKRIKSLPKQRCWKKHDIECEMPEWMYVDTETLSEENLTPVELFELFFDDGLFDVIVHETNRYASQKNSELRVTKDEMKVVFGVLLISGYVSYPRRRLFWETGRDTRHDMVSNAIRRDRFESIFTNLHFADNNTLSQTDKLAKLRPLLTKLNENFMKNAPVEEVYSFDESMCEYFGKHGCKQFIRGKPIRFGYKVWSGTTVSGYLVWFEIYQGKSGEVEEIYNDLGIGGNLVVKFGRALQKRKLLPYHLVFDNFFTSVKLLSVLKDMGLKGTGTVRENRTDKCPLISVKELKRKPRGFHDFRVDEKDNIMVCRWNDNSVVSLCSNAVGIHPKSQTTRFSRQSRQRIQVEQPAVVKFYNKSMGGVDRMDENISKYRVAIRGKKWYSPIVTYLIDIAMNNAWLLHRRNEQAEKLDLLAFRRRVVSYYLEHYARPPQPGCKGRPPATESELQFDRLNHWVIPQEKQTRCAHCHQKTTTRCEKCDKGVHVKCFKHFHTK